VCACVCEGVCVSGCTSVRLYVSVGEREIVCVCVCVCVCVRVCEGVYLFASRNCFATSMPYVQLTCGSKGGMGR
jgi:hypothetical protein